MLFNSFSFLLFLPTTFLLFWFVFSKNKFLQNCFILLISYFFYGLWDWRFLFLIALSTLIDFIAGQQIYKNIGTKNSKYWLFVSLIFNLGILGFFKYYNFFIESWVNFFALMGIELTNTWSLNIILPVGISFYTFQTLSYSLDIYYKKLKPTKNFIDFAAFVSFFPQLVAGPIERASNLLSQISAEKKFDYNQCKDGLKLILWGMFKKVVIADALAPIVDDIFFNYQSYPASTLLMGICFFSFQIYGDFSGYSDIAIGTAKLFGIELMSNFKFPYFSRNISEFWQRWHISLSDWFKNYIYIPLGGNRVGKFKSIRNIFIVFLVSGFWHGANWTFIIWGLLHAILYLPIFLSKKNRKFANTTIATNTLLPSFNEIFQVISTFSLVTFAWIFFRAETTSKALGFIKQILTNFKFQYYAHPNGYRIIDYFILLIIFIAFEYVIRKDERNPFKFKSKLLRLACYILIIFGMLLFYDDGIDRSFIYFQF